MPPVLARGTNVPEGAGGEGTVASVPCCLWTGCPAHGIDCLRWTVGMARLAGMPANQPEHSGGSHGQAHGTTDSTDCYLTVMS